MLIAHVCPVGRLLYIRSPAALGGGQQDTRGWVLAALLSIGTVCLVLTGGDKAAAMEDEWEEFIDPQTGKTFFVNHRTRETSWDPPLKAVSGWLPLTGLAFGTFVFTFPGCLLRPRTCRGPSWARACSLTRVTVVHASRCRCRQGGRSGGMKRAASSSSTTTRARRAGLTLGARGSRRPAMRRAHHPCRRPRLPPPLCYRG